jgi:hypothetical protein
VVSAGLVRGHASSSESQGSPGDYVDVKPAGPWTKPAKRILASFEEENHAQVVNEDGILEIAYF